MRVLSFDTQRFSWHLPDWSAVVRWSAAVASEFFVCGNLQTTSPIGLWNIFHKKLMITLVPELSRKIEQMRSVTTKLLTGYSLF
jgi:hypothetical protein